MSQHPPPSPHDAFFKRLLSDPATAGQFLRERLPAEIVALLSDDAPELLPGSFVDEELTQHHSDLLFRLRLAGGDDALLYLLIEHKSSPDRWVWLQVLRYITRVWDRWRLDREEPPLPPVFPLVLYHGEREWTLPLDGSNLFGPAVPEVMRPNMPAFRFALTDLGQIDDQELSRHLRLRAFLTAMKYILRCDLAGSIEVVLKDASKLDIVDVALILTYIVKQAKEVDVAAVRGVLGHVTPGREEEVMSLFMQELRAEVAAKVRDEALAEGKAEGKAEGRAEALLDVLDARFGAIPERARVAVAQAAPESLRAWLRAASTAGSIDDIIGGPH